MAVVEGRLQIRDWTDKDGGKRRSAEIVADNVYFGDSKRDGDGGYQSSGYASGGGYSGGYASGGYAPPLLRPRLRPPPATAPPPWAATSLPNSLTTTASCRFKS